MNLRRLLLLSVMFSMFAIMACEDETRVETRIVERAVGVAVTCNDYDGNRLPTTDCNTDENSVTVWIVDGDRNAVSIMDMYSGTHVDSDVVTPGFTPLPLGGLPSDICALTDSSAVVVSLFSDSQSSTHPNEPGLVLITPSQTGIDDIKRHKRQSLVMELDGTNIACLPVTMTCTQFGSAVGVLVGLNCGSSSKIAWIPEESFGSLSPTALAQSATFAFTGTVQGIACDETNSKIYVASSTPTTAEGVPAGDWIAQFAFDSPTTAIATTFFDDSSTLDSAPANAGTANCDDGTPIVTQTFSTRIAGAPAVTPGGGFVYVPMTRPSGIAIFSSELERLDVNAPTETSDGNPLFSHLGVKDIVLPSTPAYLTPVSDSTGPLVIASLVSGELIRIDVDGDEDHAPHQIDLKQDDDEGGDLATYTVAQVPTLRVGGSVLERGIYVERDQPNFGSTEIETIDGDADLYRYYGVEFSGNLEQELSETWTVSFEGTIPGASGYCGIIEQSDDGIWLIDSFANFCKKGVIGDVSKGDIVVVRPREIPSSCPFTDIDSLELRVVSAWTDRLKLDWTGVVGLDECLPTSPSPYEVRAGNSWIVTGSRTGFLHDVKTAEDGLCTTDPAGDPLLIGRAVTALPVETALVESCPIQMDDSGIDWTLAKFTNHILSFTIVAGCRTNESFNSEVVLPTRDTQLIFDVSAGLTPRYVTVSGFPGGTIGGATTVFVVDAPTGISYEIDVEEMELRTSHY